jgi:DICT domain-containing protein
MARTDVHLDARLRHLGAAYYDSLHGRATRHDVTRALQAVEEQVKARQRQAPGGATASAGVRRMRQIAHLFRLSADARSSVAIAWHPAPRYQGRTAYHGATLVTATEGKDPSAQSAQVGVVRLGRLDPDLTVHDHGAVRPDDDRAEVYLGDLG